MLNFIAIGVTQFGELISVSSGSPEVDNESSSLDGQEVQSDWWTTLTKPHGFVWYTAVSVSTGGVISIGLGGGPFILLGIALLAIGGSILALLSLATELQPIFTTDTVSTRRLFIVASSSVVLIIAIIFSSNIFQLGAELNERIVILTLGLQALFLTVDTQPPETSRRARAVLLVGSHGALLMASIDLLYTESQAFGGTLLLYVAGFAFLSLHAFWSRQRRSIVSPPRPVSRRRYWESLLLVAIITGSIGAVTIVFTTPASTLLPRSLVGRLGTVVIGEAGVVALAILSVPDSPPPVLAILTTPRSTVFQHVVAILVLTNTLFLGVSLTVPRTYTWMLAVILVLLFVGVTLNYLSVGYNLWNEVTTSTSVGERPEMPLTVVISAFNEATVLPETLKHNLNALPQAEFLLVPAASSTDGTRKIMKEIKADFSRDIRIAEGTTGSKAGDLNEAWNHINTSYVLLLDADETVVPDSVGAAYQRLNQQSNVGIVQGRKLAAYPDTSALSGFVTVERQHSTWIDHPFMSSILNSGHFAGSAAVMRREVVPDVGGFDPNALTEDIELSVRLYLETDWDLVYEPGMLVRELNPTSWLSLLRQRERWARGWAQVAVSYLGDILRPNRGLGWRRPAGLGWELFTAVSSPVYTLFPALIVYWLFAPVTPSLVISSLMFTLYLIVERPVSFVVASFFDPKIPAPQNIKTVGAALFHSYAWMIFGWIIQLHAIYLQLAGATESWDVTKKQSIDPESGGSRSRQFFKIPDTE